MTRYYLDLDSAPDWLKQISLAVRPIKIWVVTRHQYGIFALILQTSFRGENSRDVAKCRVLSQAIVVTLLIVFAARRKGQYQLKPQPSSGVPYLWYCHLQTICQTIPHLSMSWILNVTLLIHAWSQRDMSRFACSRESCQRLSQYTSL